MKSFMACLVVAALSVIAAEEVIDNSFVGINFSSSVTRMHVGVSKLGQNISGEEEHLRKLQQFPRHTKSRVVKRDVGGFKDADIAVAALNILGTGVAFIPVVGGPIAAAISIISIILPFLFPNDEPVRVTALIDYAIWKERVEEQKLKLFGYRKSINEILEQAKSDPSATTPRLIGLYGDLTQDSRIFMRSDNLGNSADYFRDFALLHMFVNDAIIFARPNDAHWKENLRRNAREYAAYAYHVVHLIPEYPEIRDLLRVSMMNWTKLLTEPELLKFMKEREGLYDLDARSEVAFKFDPCAQNDKKCRESHRWLACYPEKFICVTNTCPQAGEPAQILDCSREIFSIHPENAHGDGILRSCDKVTLQHKSSHKWLAIRFLFWQRSGSTAEPMCFTGCKNYRWTIHLAGNDGCNHRIKDHDIVLLKGGDGNGPLTPWNGLQQKFIIHNVHRPDGYEKLALPHVSRNK